jgi:hypothetical protein
MGPKEMTFMSQSKHLKKMVSFSRGLDENLIQHSLNEKKSLKLTSKVRIYNINSLENQLVLVQV